MAWRSAMYFMGKPCAAVRNGLHRAIVGGHGGFLLAGALGARSQRPQAACPLHTTVLVAHRALPCCRECSACRQELPKAWLFRGCDRGHPSGVESPSRWQAREPVPTAIPCRAVIQDHVSSFAAFGLQAENLERIVFGRIAEKVATFG